MFHPTLDRIYVEVLPHVESKTAGGIVLPDTKKFEKRGVVLSVGPGRVFVLESGVKEIPPAIKPGQIVYFGGGVEIEPNRYVIMEQDVLGMEVK